MSNYKVGDKVLVEMKILMENCDGYFLCRSSGNLFIDHKIHPKDIHSLVPEFKSGELVEVKADTWWPAYYIGKEKSGKFVTEDAYSGIILAWNNCRKPQQPKEETKQDQFVTMPDGKKYKLVEVEE